MTFIGGFVQRITHRPVPIVVNGEVIPDGVRVRRSLTKPKPGRGAGAEVTVLGQQLFVDRGIKFSVGSSPQSDVIVSAGILAAEQARVFTLSGSRVISTGYLDAAEPAILTTERLEVSVPLETGDKSSELKIEIDPAHRFTRREIEKAFFYRAGEEAAATFAKVNDLHRAYSQSLSRWNLKDVVDTAMGIVGSALLPILTFSWSISPWVAFPLFIVFQLQFAFGRLAVGKKHVYRKFSEGIRGLNELEKFIFFNKLSMAERQELLGQMSWAESLVIINQGKGFLASLNDSRLSPGEDFRALIKEPVGYTVEKNNFGIDGAFMLEYTPEPDKLKANAPIIVNVHGYGHGAPHFDNTAAELAGENGLRVVSLSLPGHYGDERVMTDQQYSQNGTPEYASFVAAAVGKISAQYGLDVVLVGHSMGGGVVMQAANLSDKVKGVVLLSAMGTSDSHIGMKFGVAKQISLNFLRLIRNLPTIIVDKPARDLFFNSLISDDDFHLWREAYQPESGLATWDIVRAALPARIFKHFWKRWTFRPEVEPKGEAWFLNVLAGADQIISEGGWQRISKHLIGLGSQVEELILEGLPHCFMMTHPESTALAIVQKLQKEGLYS